MLAVKILIKIERSLNEIDNKNLTTTLQRKYKLPWTAYSRSFLSANSIFEEILWVNSLLISENTLSKNCEGY